MNRKSTMPPAKLVSIESLDYNTNKILHNTVILWVATKHYVSYFLIFKGQSADNRFKYMQLCS